MPPAKPRPSPTRRRIQLGLLAVGLGIVAPCLLLELGLRLFDPVHTGELLERERFAEDVLGRDETDGSLALRPGHSGTLFGHSHQIGPHGFRGPAFPKDKSPDTFRVLVVGDSVAFGWGVAEDEAFPNVAERLLNEDDPAAGLAGREHVEVLTAACPGWGAPNYLKVLGEQELAADCVVVTLINNDLTDVLEAISGDLPPPPSGPPGWLRWSYLAHAVDRGMAVATARREKSDFFAEIDQLDATGRAQTFLCTIFGDMKQTVGATPLVVMDTVTDGEQQLDRFAACLPGVGVERFRFSLPNDPDAPRAWFVGATDDHPNAAGHRRMARSLVAWLRGRFRD